MLGCTHYPFVSEHLQALAGADVLLVENGETVAWQTLRLLHAAAGRHNPEMARHGRVSLLSTGNAQTLKASAAHWLDLCDQIDLLQI